MISKWRIGLGGSDHDFSAALMHNLDIRVAIEEERLSRRKHGYSFWYQNPAKRSIDYCLEAEGVTIEDVEGIVSSDVLPARLRSDLRGSTLTLFPHHLCHAASAYMMLPPGAKAIILVYDGFGSPIGPAINALQTQRETFSFFAFDEDGYKCLGRTCGLGFVEQGDFPTGATNSIGILYELVTSLLGYDSMDAGKTMGLSSHGDPRYLYVLEEFITYGEDMADCFRCDSNDPNLAAALSAILMSSRDSFSVRADIAASLQAVVNKTLLHCARLFDDRRADYLCVSGGSGLNTVANSFLVEHSPFDIPIIIPPHCGDSGIGLGALWLDAFNRLGCAPEITFRGGLPTPHLARPGRRYAPREIREAARQFYPELVHDASITCAHDVARLLADGQIIAVLNGSSEIGPRALGGRSIFADPRSATTRERINRRIKRREPFRPLAPVVLWKHYDDYFIDERCADPFMLKIARARERLCREAPATVHVDGTARVQVVPQDGDPFLVELLQAFYEATNVGILINTSFNRRGEPIVESPLDAVDAFLGMELDGLYLDGDFYRPAGARPTT